MTKEYLKREELIIGGRYEVEGRNFNTATWTGEEFIGMREKFGARYLDEELHWDDDSKYGTVKPLKYLDMKKISEKGATYKR